MNWRGGLAAFVIMGIIVVVQWRQDIIEYGSLESWYESNEDK